MASGRPSGTGPGSAPIFARDICEAALAHIVKDKTEAAYRGGDLFEKRRELIATWAAFVPRVVPKLARSDGQSS
jgi:hypothetical protein